MKSDGNPFVVAVVLLILAGIICLVIFTHYFVFFVLPFLILSALLGGFFFLVTRIFEGEGGGDEGEREMTENPKAYNYKALIYFYPLAILVTVVVFLSDSQQHVKVNKKGETIGIYIEWPKLYKRFNEFRREHYESSAFEVFKRAAQREELYDRKQISWIAWWALILGAPAVFLWLTRLDEEKEQELIKKNVDEKVSLERERLQDQFEFEKRGFSKQISQLEANASKLSKANQDLQREVNIYRAKMEFAPVKINKLSEVESGILDRDIL